MKHVIVPQSDIDNIEQSRLKLWAFFDCNFKDDGSVESMAKAIEMQRITQPMWYIANRKFPETLLSKIKQFITFSYHKQWIKTES